MSDNLTSLRGVGPELAERLHAAGFQAPDDVLESDPKDLTEVPGIGESTAEAIINQDGSGYKGRPSKLEEHWDDIMAAAELGLTYEGIARKAGIGVRTLHEWREQDDEFVEALEKHRAIGEQKLVERVAEEKPEFILERSYKYTKEQDINLDADVDAEHDVTADFVTYTADDEDDGDE